MNIIPDGYPNIWVGKLKRWVSEEYYMHEVNPERYEQMTHGAYDEEYAVAFTTRKFQEDGLTYSVMLASVGMVEDDIYIYAIDRLFGTNEEPNYDTHNYPSEQLEQHSELRYFQKNERFYAEIQEVISVLKRDIILICEGLWYQSYYVTPI